MIRKITCLITTLIIVFSFACTCVYGAEEAVPILLYHHIEDYDPTADFFYDPATNISAELFEDHMKNILLQGFNPITYEQYYNYVTHGTPLPYKPIIISFDDGYLSNYLYAYPIIKRYKIPTTIFVITDRRGMALSRNPHFSWNQAREMQDSGYVDIQSHTYSHQMLTTLSEEEIYFELKTSKDMIERNMGKKCSVIAFPFGDSNARVKEIAGEVGYVICNDVGNKGTNRASEGLMDLKRITVRANWSTDFLLDEIERNYAY